MNIDHFDLCGISLSVECESTVQGERASELLTRLFEISRHASRNGRTSLTIRVQTGIQKRDPGGREIFSSHHLCVFETRGGYLVQCGASFTELDLASSLACGSLDDDFWEMPVQVQRAFFFLPLLFLLPRHGFYGLHANGAVRDGVGFLIAGGSGRGKTTLTLALMREGWSYLSDDTVLLHACDTGIEALNFRRGFACTADTLTRFPELNSELSSACAWKADKAVVDLNRLYPGRGVARSEPRVILFPEIAHTDRSVLLPLDSGTALTLLVQQSPGVLTQRASVEAQMDVLQRLISAARSWRLLLGTDVYQNPVTVSNLLWEASNAHHG